ncbi:MAG TPA: helix-turn-helix transcriptional regulator [Terriglobales bacterium]|nr:helix-turn-helix transcriptional regulator [Terriglobales bacterium]
MISTEALSRLLLTLYSAPASPQLWPNFLEQFVEVLGISGAGIVCQDKKRVKYGYSATTRVDPELLRAYHTYYGKLDPQIPPIAQIVPGQISLGHELCDPEKFRRTEYFNDFVAKYDISLYCALPTSKTTESVEAVTFYTGFHDETPGKGTLELIRLMTPHLQTALHLRRRMIDLRAQSSSLESAMDLMEYGIMFLDSGRNVLWMNRSAESLLRRADGLSCRGGCLHVSFRIEFERLRSLIESSAGTANGKGAGSGGSMLVSRESARPLTVTVAPLTNVEGRGISGAAAVLFVYDPELQVKPPLDLLQQGYGLTKAEARLALVLVEGHSLKDAAEKCSVTHNTVRSQLKSIFTKTGVRHQGELIRLLLRSHLSSSAS